MASNKPGLKRKISELFCRRQRRGPGFWEGEASFLLFEKVADAGCGCCLLPGRVDTVEEGLLQRAEGVLGRRLHEDGFGCRRGLCQELAVGHVGTGWKGEGGSEQAQYLTLRKKEVAVCSRCSDALGGVADADGAAAISC